MKSKIYTKTGDKGYTCLLPNKRMSKAHSRIASLSLIDELNSILGVIKAFNSQKGANKLLSDVQNILFIIQAEIAGAKKTLTKEKTKRLEETIDRLSLRIPEIKKFILPGGTKISSLLYWSRAVTRRAEIEIVKFSHQQKINPEILKYLNRLSDFLYILARFENRKTKEDSPWY